MVMVCINGGMWVVVVCIEGCRWWFVLRDVGGGGLY